MSRKLIVAGSLCVTALAQATPDRLLVVSEHATAPLARLYEVERQSGAVVPVSVSTAAPWAAEVPLALAVDPATTDVVLATWDAPANATRLTRLQLDQAVVVAEAALPPVPGRAAAVTVQANGDVFAAVPGVGVFRAARDGGPTALVWTAPTVFGLSENVVLPDKYFALTKTGTGQSSLVTFLANAPGAPLGTMTLLNTNGFDYTAVHEHTNGTLGQVRELLVSDTGGGLWEGSATLGLFPKVVAPPIAPGGAERMKAKPGPDRDVWILGGAADPTLKLVLESSPQFPPPVVVVAGPLPGAPVDFGYTGDVDARSYRFGAACVTGGTQTGEVAASGAPQLGNAQLQVELRGGAPSTFALAAIGTQALAAPIAVPPQACPLHFTPTVVLTNLSDAAGDADQPLPIPNAPALQGAIVFAQWWQLAPPLAPYGTATLALHVW